MGGDGGSTNVRKFVVQTSQRNTGVSNSAQVQKARAETCALSGKPLSAPLCICKLGLLYNYEEVVLYLDDLAQFKKTIQQLAEKLAVEAAAAAAQTATKSTNSSSTSLASTITTTPTTICSHRELPVSIAAQLPPSSRSLHKQHMLFPHLNKLSDIIRINLHNPEGFIANTASSSSASTAIANKNQPHIVLCCPIADLPLNGVHAFICMRGCGCVMSQRGYDILHGGQFTIENKQFAQPIRACPLCNNQLAYRFQPSILQNALRRQSFQQIITLLQQKGQLGNDFQLPAAVEQTVPLEFIFPLIRHDKKLLQRTLDTFQPLLTNEEPFIPVIPNPAQTEGLKSLISAQVKIKKQLLADAMATTPQLTHNKQSLPPPGDTRQQQIQLQTQTLSFSQEGLGITPQKRGLRDDDYRPNTTPTHSSDLTTSPLLSKRLRP